MEYKNVMNFGDNSGDGGKGGGGGIKVIRKLREWWRGLRKGVCDICRKQKETDLQEGRRKRISGRLTR